MEKNKDFGTIRIRNAKIMDICFLFKLTRTTKYRRKRTLRQIIEDIKSRVIIIERYIPELWTFNSVGAIREYEQEISIVILPEYRGKGIGKEALKKYLEKTALIECENTRSLKLFKGIGFKEIKKVDDYVLLKIEIERLK